MKFKPLKYALVLALSLVVLPLSAQQRDELNREEQKEVEQLLNEIVKDVNDVRVLCAVARHPYVPSKLLANLFERRDLYPNNEVLIDAIASNERSSKSLLKEIYQTCATSSLSRQEVLIENPSTPSAIVEELVNKNVRTLLEGAAQNRNIKKRVVQRLIDSEDSDIRAALADNPKLTKQQLVKLATDRSEKVRYAVIDNPKISTDLVNELAFDKCDEVRFKAASSSKISNYLLTKFSLSSSVKERCAVAINPKASVALLTRLGRDTDKLVLQHLAGNSATPPSILQRLATDEMMYIYLASNEKLPIDIALKIANNKSVERSYYLATLKKMVQNPSLTREVLEAIRLNSSSKELFYNVIEANIPPYILRLNEAFDLSITISDALDD